VLDAGGGLFEQPASARLSERARRRKGRIGTPDAEGVLELAVLTFK
jgi:hypothetical protein